MSISKLFAEKSVVFSFEIFPPKRDSSIDTIWNTLEQLEGLGPDFISVTYGAGGGGGKSYTAQIAGAIRRRYGILPLAHLTCVNSTREEIRQSLADLREEGVEDILALRGDRIPGVEPKTDFLHASDLVTFIREEGGFSLSGACYPEVHTEAPDPVTDVLNLKKKVDAGAEHLVSQLFFDNAAFYAFVERARIAGITVPIEAGIMPVVNARQITRMVSLCGASLPQKFVRMISRYEGNPAALRDAGIAYAVDQIVDLIAQGVEGIHLYTMNDPAVARRISGAVENLRKA